MKKTLFGLLIMIFLLGASGCGRGEGGAAGYGAGGGQSLRQGSTSPLHSSIAQDPTYQKLLGLNILLYPPPVDDPKFEPFGSASWDLDTKAYIESVKAKFTGQKGDLAVYEPKVDGLADDPLVKQIQDTVYEGKPVQVGWVYGSNDSLDYLEYNGGPVTIIPTENSLIFVGDKAKLDPAKFTYDVKDTKAFYMPAGSVVTLKADTLHSAPIRVSTPAGQLTVVIVPDGTGVEPASAGTGIDQALVAKNRWVWAFPDIAGFFAGLTGTNKEIVPAD